MQSQPLASNNPGRESRAIRDAEEFGALCDALRLPDADRSRFKAWVLACTNPRGLRFYMSREVKVGAVAAGCCETTMRKTVRKLERLGLVHEQPDTNLRTKKHWVDVERLRRQNWKTGLCGRCNHKHGPDGECGHPLEARKWHRRREDQPRLVKRTCRCAPREILPPKKYGPQSVPPQAPPEASPPVQPAAQPSPAAPARETHRSIPSTRRPSSRTLREVRKVVSALVPNLMKPHASAETRTESGQMVLRLPQSAVQPKLDVAPDPWAEILYRIRKSMNPHSYGTWFHPTRFQKAEGKRMFVQLPTAEFAHVGDKYREWIERAVADLGLGYEEIVFGWAETIPLELPALPFREAVLQVCDENGIPLAEALEATGWKQKFEEPEEGP